MKIILSGGGNGKQTEKIDSLFFNLVDDKKVVFIPHSRDKKEFTSSLNWVKSNIFQPHNHDNFEMWTSLKDKSIKDLEGVKGIIIGGGNTFRLLKEFRNSNFSELLKYFIENEGIVYGISAGAIILTKSIITAKPIDNNKENLRNLEGINFLNNLGIFCHYEKKYDKDISNIIKKRYMNVVGLPEGCGVYINNKTQKIIGNNPATLFSSEGIKKELNIGEEIKY